jgi:hypothetical protein
METGTDVVWLSGFFVGSALLAVFFYWEKILNWEKILHAYLRLYRFRQRTARQPKGSQKRRVFTNIVHKKDQQ